MQIPRILALDDVKMAATRATAEKVGAFYVDLVGLDRVPARSNEQQMVFHGYPPRGPHLVVRLDDSPTEESRRRVLIQIPSLQEYAERLTDSMTPWQEVHGWAYYDRRISALDPAGNIVEFVSYHTF